MTTSQNVQLTARLLRQGIKDKAVLKAFEKVDRKLFVPESLQDLAYEDRPLSIGEEQTISQPYIVAYMTEALELKKADRVLEIGTGSGYQLAILGELSDDVYSIEIVESLAKKSSQLLQNLGYTNITTKWGDAYGGWPEKAPFDKIILTASPPQMPQPLLEQLKEGGALVSPVGESQQKLIKIIKTKAGYEERVLLPVSFVPMTGEAQDL